jgi:hypothetical protein
MAPSTEFPGNVFYAITFFGFIAFFVYSAGIRYRWFARGQWVNRFGDPIRRAVGLIPRVLANERVARRKYWYSGMLHSLIFWGFIVLQIRTLNFLLNGIHEDVSLESALSDVYTIGLRPLMDVFNLLVIVGVLMAAWQRFFWRPQRMTLNLDGWICLGLIGWMMVTDIFANSAEIALERPNHQWASFTAFGFAELWDGIGFTGEGMELFHVAWWYSHLVTFLVFLVYLPYSKHSHVITVAPSMVCSSRSRTSRRRKASGRASWNRSTGSRCWTPTPARSAADAPRRARPTSRARRCPRSKSSLTSATSWRSRCRLFPPPLIARSRRHPSFRR